MNLWRNPGAGDRREGVIWWTRRGNSFAPWRGSDGQTTDQHWTRISQRDRKQAKPARALENHAHAGPTCQVGNIEAERASARQKTLEWDFRRRWEKAKRLHQCGGSPNTTEGDSSAKEKLQTWAIADFSGPLDSHENLPLPSVSSVPNRSPRFLLSLEKLFRPPSSLLLLLPFLFPSTHRSLSVFNSLPRRRPSIPPLVSRRPAN